MLYIYNENISPIMNIADSETSNILVAKTCGCKTSGRVAYSFVDTYHSLCLDRKEIVIAELQACERLLKYGDELEIKIIKKEIDDLKLALDLME